MNRPDPAIIREFLDCDPASGKLWWRHRDRKWFVSDGMCKMWNTRYAGKEGFTAVRDNGYKVGNVFNRNIRAHQVVWCHTFGFWPTELDHIDGDRQNNAISNLRQVDRRENTRNASLTRSNTSGVTGVMWDKRAKRWRVEIGVNYKNVRIGNFIEFDDAVRARKQAERDYGFHPNHGKAVL